MEIILRKKKQVKDIVSHKDLKISGSKFRLGRGADQEIHLPNSRVALEHAILEIDKNDTLTLTATKNHTFIHNNITTTKAQLSEEDSIQIGGFFITPKYSSDGLVILEIFEKFTDQTKAMKQELIGRTSPGLEDSFLSKRLLAVVISLSVLVVALIFPFSYLEKKEQSTLKNVSNHILMPGSLSIHHSDFSSDCTNCHEGAFDSNLTEACKSCHEGNMDHAGSSHVSFNLEMESMECTSCHWEHHNTETNAISRQDEGFCADCHGAEIANSDLLVVKRFKKHPQFRVPYKKRQGEDGYDLISISSYQQNSELSMIRFPHSSHLDNKLQNNLGQETELECSYCHVSDATGEMNKVSYEEHCDSCHQIELTNNSSEKLILPHKYLREVVTKVNEFYKDESNFNVTSSTNDDTSLVIPGSQRVPLTNGDRNSNYQNLADAKLQEIVFYTGCNTCHNVVPDFEQTNFPWKIQSVDPVNWYSKALFNHKAHEDQECAECHMGIEQSNSSLDINLPNVEYCQSCHLGGWGSPLKTASTCVTCHIFHIDPVTIEPEQAEPYQETRAH